MIQHSRPYLAAAQPTVAIIVTVYNKAQYLVETMQAIAASGYPALEVMVGDDGSTDDSPRLVDELPRLFPSLNFKIFHKQNSGVSDSRNFLIKRATAPLVLAIDADDIMKPGFIPVALDRMRRENANVITCDIELFGTETGTWVPPDYDPYEIRFNNCCSGTFALYDRFLWEQVGGFDVSFPFNEDWNFLVQLSRLGATFKKIPQFYFRYRTTGTGLFHHYIKETWPHSVSLIITANEDLYGVDEVIWAMSQLNQMPERWHAKLLAQDQLHPGRWLTKLWLALFNEGRGNIPHALHLYQEALALAPQRTTWIMLYKLATLAESANQSFAVQAYHQIRTIRPDMSRHVNDRMKRLLSAAAGTGLKA